MEELLQVGAITSTHGVRGEVKVFPTTDDPKRFGKLKEVELETKEGTTTLHIKGVKYFKQFVILKFAEYDSLNDVESIKGRKLFVTRKNAVKLKKDEYFICDLIGCMVITEDGTEVGELTEVLQTAANDVFVVQGKGKKEILVPYIDDCVKNVSMDEKKVTVVLLPGMAE